MPHSISAFRPVPSGLLQMDGRFRDTVPYHSLVSAQDMTYQLPRYRCQNLTPVQWPRHQALIAGRHRSVQIDPHRSRFCRRFQNSSLPSVKTIGGWRSVEKRHGTFAVCQADC